MLLVNCKSHIANSSHNIFILQRLLDRQWKHILNIISANISCLLSKIHLVRNRLSWRYPTAMRQGLILNTCNISKNTSIFDKSNFRRIYYLWRILIFWNSGGSFHIFQIFRERTWYEVGTKKLHIFSLS